MIAGPRLVKQMARRHICCLAGGLPMTEQNPDPAVVPASYADGPAQLEAAMAGLTEAGLDMALTAGTWTIRQYVHHVVDGDDIWSVYIKVALGNPHAVFTLQWYWDIPQDRWAESWNYGRRAIDPSLALFHANRRHIVQLVQGIAGSWELAALLKRPNGQEVPITVGAVIEMQARHVTGHIEDIRAIRGRHQL